MRRANSDNATGILGHRQRRWVWVAFAVLVLNAPVTAYAVPTEDTWALSVAVAALVAYVLVVDDVKRRKPTRDQQSS